MSMKSRALGLLLGLGLAALCVTGATAAPAKRAAGIPSSPGIAGTLPVSPVQVVSSGVFDFRAAATRQARMPSYLLPPERVLMTDERDGDEDFQPLDEAGAAPMSPFVMGQQLNLPSPAPGNSFAGLDDIAMADSGYIIIPPDVNGTVGPTKIFQMLNNNVRILDKATGAVLSTVGTNTFWAPTGASANNYTDPRALYDPYNNRFIALMQGDLDKSTANSLCLAISDTNDPQGTWHMYRFSCYENSTYQYADFPTMGFNKNWIAISINMYTSAQTQVRRSVFMVHYPTLLNSNTATVYRADNATSNIICGSPVVTYSTAQDTEFVMQRRGTSTYSIDYIVGAGPSAPTYVTGAAITRPGGTWNAMGTSNYYPQSAPVSGSSVCGTTPCAIERSDDNIRTPGVFRNGNIYFVQQVGLPSSGATHVGIQWTQITTNGAFVVGGRLQDTLATTSNGRPHFANPSISVNAANDFMIGFTRFSSQQHPGAGYAMHLASDGVGTLRDTVIFHDGEDYYHKTFSTNTGRNRWGDYSATMVDPSDDISFWTVQEYAKARKSVSDTTTGANGSRWATWWAQATPGNSYVIAATASAGGTITPAGSVVVNAGNNQAFAIAANSCYAITDVKVDGVSQGAITAYTFSNVTASHTIAATFAINTYTISIPSVANCTFSPSTSANVNCGGSQIVTVTPASCFHVQDFIVDGSSVGAVTSYTFSNVTAGHTVNAIILQNGSYTINVTAGANGSITPGTPQSVPCGTDRAFAIAANSCYHIQDVTVDNVSVGAVGAYTFVNVQANHHIKAFFAINTYNIVASATGNGAIAPSGTTIVNCGSDAAYTLTPQVGFYVSSLLVDGSPVAPALTYTFSNVQAAHTIAATFSPDTSVVSAAAAVPTATISAAHPSLLVPVVINRFSTTPLLGFSVTVRIPADLSVNYFASGDFLAVQGATLFNSINHQDGTYTVDMALTENCGAVSTSGTLFYIAVGSAQSSGGGNIQIVSAKLRDCNNVDQNVVAGASTAIAIDQAGPSLAVLSPNGGENLAVGTHQNLTWSASDPNTVASVDLFLSRAGASGPFDSIATNQPNSGSFDWVVTGPATTNAFLKVVARDSLGNSSQDLSDASFTIASGTTGVDGGAVTEFALSSVVPNPSRGLAHVTFALPRDAHVHVSVVDLQGREVLTLADGVYGAGRHVAELSNRGTLTPGLYFVRMQAAGKTFTTRFAVMK